VSTRRFVLLALVLAPGFAGCGAGGDFSVAKTTGRVVCEGQPVPYAMLFFEPLQTNEASALVGAGAFARADGEGKFVLSTYGDRDGAVIGKHRVRVGSADTAEHPGWTCPCVTNSEVDVMEVEVKGGQTNEFEVVLPKKTGREIPERIDVDEE
jgi:hypothetical protein